MTYDLCIQFLQNFEEMLKITVFMDTIKFRLLRVTDQYVHETIRIMKLPLIYVC